MKNKINIVSALLILCLSACELDNYKAPDSQLYGKVVDEDTNEPIQQDMFDGSRIDYVEQGFKNPTTRYLRIQTDGAYRENNLFSGKYEVQALRGNFFPTEKTMIDINGSTEYIFRSKPYIRIKDVGMTFDKIRGEVTAEFTLDNVADNAVETIHLIADENPNLSNTLRTAMATKKVNAVVTPDRKFKVPLSTEKLMSGKEYYFRVAALISGISEAKHNYSKPVRIAIDNSQVIPGLPILGKVIDACESLDGWGGAIFELSLDTEDKKEGNACLKVEVTEDPYHMILSKVFKTFDPEVSMEDGYLAFDLYVSDVSVLTGGLDSEFELTSSGDCDVQELTWKTSQINLTNGWNKVELSLADAGHTGGDINLHAVNFIRFYSIFMPSPITIKLDHIRFYEK